MLVRARLNSAGHQPPSRGRDQGRALPFHGWVIVKCTTCGRGVQSVKEYCESLPQGLNYVPYAVWLPLNLASGCASCIAKEPLLTVTPADLLVGNMVEADVTVKAVCRAMYETETIRVPEALEEYQKRLPGEQPLVAKVMEAAAAVVEHHYQDVKGEIAHTLLVLKLQVMMRKLVGSMLPKLDMQAKMSFQCVDGQAAFTMSLMVIPVPPMPDRVDENDRLRVPS